MPEQIKSEETTPSISKPIEDPHAVFRGEKPPARFLAMNTDPVYAKLFNCGPVKIPEDCIFVLGDNRRLARDSRIVGPIPISEYVGKPRLIYLSRKRIPLRSEEARQFMPSPTIPGPIQWDRIGMRLDVDEKSQP